ncbi:hypothetical protein [Streptomyces sp. NBC_00199]|uniref:hypothetical protein n=1 Tax=Streptomyces sp. NBC_00199 TaxID=2975678 RepID=UPI002B1D01AB|nr:hypothetical protein [Streptomyces sp. NBC_00199]
MAELAAPQTVSGGVLAAFGFTHLRWSHRTRTPPARGPLPVQLITLGRTTKVFPASADAGLCRDLVAVPVLDASPVTTVIVWPPRSRLHPVADPIRVATRL